ncbi:hypothetical protein ACSCB1_30825 [Streptomyces europaeiscabiei]|uniref:hypothetical protein n=1 Tax=Streptomyces europaeiscabiei TaxID=146819 RepID=UPI000628311E|nr:hypothetical protein [Streptomyces europaeiscabiei]MDX2760174.1 hypothetical protein [Streptomyces europaeiscabiei]MDX2769954.1 hypothetical protein [Streptomyces europaeiscabiei]MDX3712067.1 hypothetical protein [Streptomyces europaeiscabiei]MDX3865371.1 hypothetical protein [Streptomyces europaeiscabiei]MDX3872243.1 hypothetical protein [Streptomyces europaeiscabiei]
MTIARHLVTIDRLCSEEFPATHGRSDTGTAGPGYHVAELGTSGDFWEDDGTRREETEAQFEADRDALSVRLTERWGPPDVFSLWSVSGRCQEGEDIPEPWGPLSSHVPDVHLWQANGHGRWVALGVSQWDKELPFQLIALITEIDPP